MLDGDKITITCCNIDYSDSSSFAIVHEGWI